MPVSDWSVARVSQLAPDAASLTAAQGLAKPARWQGLGRSGQIVWGLCQGSGSNPYQVRVDLEEVAYKCSCPSRKLPCKHTLGLLLILAGGERIAETTPPGFAEEWMAARATRAEAKAAKQGARSKPPDVEAQARRAVKREGRVAAGLDHLEVWLADIVSHGLASARTRPWTFWSEMAARLVDAQAPGLGRRVRELGALAASPDWPSRLLVALARLQLLIDGHRRAERLPDDLVAELRTRVGWSQSQDQLLSRDGIRDRWQVLGVRQTQDDELSVQHTWLAGQATSRVAHLLEFAAEGQTFSSTFETGQLFDGELVFFDGVPPLRALVKHRAAVGEPARALPAPRDVLNAQQQYAELLASNPWLDRWPMVVGPVSLVLEHERWQLVDVSGRRLPVFQSFKHGWHLVVLAGDGTLDVFGEWDGHSFFPVSVGGGGRIFSLVTLATTPVLLEAA